MSRHHPALARPSTARLAAVALLVALAGCGSSSGDAAPPPAGAPSPGAPVAPPPAATDLLYPAGFSLPALAADPIPPLSRPTAKATGLDAPSWVDPTYRTRVYKATAASDFTGATHVRHEYSRRQAFNADNTRFLASASNGYWVLYDAGTFRVLPRSGEGGSLRGLVGDAEPIWHPTDPRTLFYYSGLVWYAKDVETDRDTVMADFRGRLPWPGATHVWTKSEGTSSADGRHWAFVATSYDERTKQTTVHGLLTYDREADRIVGTLDASRFGGAMPDHVSITPSGRFAVPSWAFDKSLGTRAYPLDFSSHRMLHEDSEHSDLAIGPGGEDYYVYTDYVAGAIRARNVATGTVFDLLPLYPREGAGYAAHVSGQAFGRPGWVVVSTYADTSGYGAVAPDTRIEAPYRKVMLVELKPGGRRLSVAHTRAAGRYGGYFGEHQATISRDGTRILFATNFDDGGPPSSYLVLLPTSVYATTGR